MNANLLLLAQNLHAISTYVCRSIPFCLKIVSDSILIHVQQDATLRYTVYFIWKLLYMFRVVVPPPETRRAVSR